jgi:hypothetical protein
MEARVSHSEYVFDLFHWPSNCQAMQADVACRKGLCGARGLSIGLHVIAVGDS